MATINSEVEIACAECGISDVPDTVSCTVLRFKAC